MRNKSERPEAIEAGNAKLVGTNELLIMSYLNKLLYDRNIYNKFISNKNPLEMGKHQTKYLIS